MSRMVQPLMQAGGMTATAMGQPEIGIPLSIGGSMMGKQQMQQPMPQAPAANTAMGQMQPMNMGSLGGSMGGMGMNPQMMQMFAKMMGMM